MIEPAIDPVIGTEWRAGLDDPTTAEVRALASAATAADGSAPLSDEVLRALRADGSAHLLARDGGELVGFAHLDPDGSELVVAPARRRAGVGTALARALLERADGPLRVWAHGEHPGAVALAERLGFTRTRTLWQMHLDLPDAPPEPALPDGVRLRPFVVGADEDEFLRVNNAAFAWHPEQGGWGVDQVREREAEAWFDPAGFLLAVDAGDRLLGFHWTKVHGIDAPAADAPGGGPEPMGEVYVLGVDPAARGMHLGSVLTVAGLRHLHARGPRRVLLYVESDNDAAVRLYRALGFTLRHSDVLYAR